MQRTIVGLVTKFSNVIFEQTCISYAQSSQISDQIPDILVCPKRIRKYTNLQMTLRAKHLALRVSIHRPQRGFKRNRVLPQNRVLARPLRASGERCSAETCTSAESCTCLAAALTLIRAAPLSGGAGSRESCTSTETCTCVPLRASGEGCSAETCTSAESCTCALALRTLQIVYFREAPGAFALRVLLFFYI